MLMEVLVLVVMVSSVFVRAMFQLLEIGTELTIKLEVSEGSGASSVLLSQLVMVFTELMVMEGGTRMVLVVLLFLGLDPSKFC